MTRDRHRTLDIVRDWCCQHSSRWAHVQRLQLTSLSPEHNTSPYVYTYFRSNYSNWTCSEIQTSMCVCVCVCVCGVCGVCTCSVYVFCFVCVRCAVCTCFVVCACGAVRCGLYVCVWCGVACGVLCMCGVVCTCGVCVVCVVCTCCTVSLWVWGVLCYLVFVCQSKKPEILNLTTINNNNVGRNINTHFFSTGKIVL
jgi:hypothetical protein